MKVLKNKATKTRKNKIMKILCWEQGSDIEICFINKDYGLIQSFIDRNACVVDKYNFFKDENGYCNPDEVVCTIMFHDFILFKKSGECDGAYFYEVNENSTILHPIDRETAILFASRVDFRYKDTLDFKIREMKALENGQILI